MNMSRYYTSFRTSEKKKIKKQAAQEDKKAGLLNFAILGCWQFKQFTKPAVNSMQGLVYSLGLIAASNSSNKKIYR